MPSLFFISLMITMLIIVPVLYLWDRRRRRRKLDGFERGVVIPLGRGKNLPPIPTRVHADVDKLVDVSSPTKGGQFGFYPSDMKVERPLTKRQKARARRQRKKLREKLAKGK